jgi:hypothetical protein
MNITSSILHLIPEAQFMCWENDYARVTWNDTNTQPLPSLADLELAWVEVQANIAANKYQELRAAEYNLKSTGEQFGMMFDDATNSTTTWVDWQQGIKTRIPK